MEPFRYENRVRYSEVDLDAKLSLRGLLNLFQDTSVLHSEDVGIGFRYLHDRNLAWLLSSWQVVLIKRPDISEHIVSSTWAYDFKGLYGLRNFTLEDASGELLAYANSIWFLYNSALGKPVRIPKEISGPYHSEEFEPFPMEYAPRHILMPETMAELPSITVSPSEIDTNRHVNNVQYVELARQALPELERTKEIRVEYKKMAVLGNVIHPLMAKQDDRVYLALNSDQGEPYALMEIMLSGDTF